MDPIGFLTSIRALFPVRHESPEAQDAWFESYASELAGFSSQELEIACGVIKRTRNANGREGRFPSLAECLEECKDARKLFAQRKREEMLPGVVDDEAGLSADEQHTRRYGSGRRKVVWGTLMKTDMAKQAAREGWIGMLYPYAFQHGSLPKDPKQIAEMKREAKAIDNWHSDGKPTSRVVANVKIIILQKRDWLARLVLEGREP